jgi:hypothetical protein
MPAKQTYGQSEMSETSSPRFRRNRSSSVEEIEARIGMLVARRQSLRQRGAGPDVLERNRRQLARCHWELSFALIERYLPESQAA